MIAVLDSATPPSQAQADAAHANGVRMWDGYIATRTNVGLLRPWTLAEFNVVKRLDARMPVAYCSGWDDPVALRQLAAQWGVLLCLDCESGIRGLGSWTQSFLNLSGAGLYGPASVHSLSAPFHILAAYPGFNPNATWASNVARPPTPCGWQYQGTHTEFGVSVDRNWFDDWFLTQNAQGDDMFSQADRDMLTRILSQLADGRQATADANGNLVPVPASWPNFLPAKLQEIEDAVNNKPAPSVNTDSLASALVPLLAPHLLDTTALAAALIPPLQAALPPAVDAGAVAQVVATLFGQRLKGS